MTAAILRQATIVILAQNYNPSIVSNEWLKQKQILGEDIASFVHTPVFSTAETKHLGLILDEGRLQLSAKGVKPEHLDSLQSAAKKFVETLPETPYRAVGINLLFDLEVTESRFSAVFAPSGGKLRVLFGDDYELGAKVTFSHEGFLVRMEIPATAWGSIAGVTFNFHRDVSGSTEALESIAKQPDVLSRANAIVESLSSDA